MPHLDYVRLSGQWLTIMVLTPGDLRRFDVAQYVAIEADAGGSYAPTTPIAFGGAGVQLSAGAHQLAGGIYTFTAGRVVLGHSDYPTYMASYSRAISVPLVFGYFGGRSLPRPVTSLISGGTVMTVAGETSASFQISGRDLHRGATVSEVQLGFSIGQPHLAIPATLPSGKFVRSDWYFDYYINQNWTESTSVEVGALVAPTVPNGYLYASASEGTTSSTTQPTWPTTVGSTVIDSLVSGTTASIAFVSGTTYSVTGLTGITAGMLNNSITVSGSAHAGNNGTFEIASQTSTSVTVVNPSGAPDASASVHWNVGIVWACTGYGPASLWQASTAYSFGNYVVPPASVGMLYECIIAGTSAATQPVWPTTVGATVIDNPGSSQVEWECHGTPGPFPWQASFAYTVGSLISPVYATGATTNGLIFQCQRTGESGASAPDWVSASAVDDQITDNATKWICMGSMTIGQAQMPEPASAGAYYNGGQAQVLAVPCTGGGPDVIQTDVYSYTFTVGDEQGLGAFGTGPAWQGSSFYGTGVSVQPSPPNGFYYFSTNASTEQSGVTPPVWPLVVGVTVNDGPGPVVWECAGQAGPSLNTYQSATFAFINIVNMTRMTPNVRTRVQSLFDRRLALEQSFAKMVVRIFAPGAPDLTLTNPDLARLLPVAVHVHARIKYVAKLAHPMSDCEGERLAVSLGENIRQLEGLHLKIPRMAPVPDDVTVPEPILISSEEPKESPVSVERQACIRALVARRIELEQSFRALAAHRLAPTAHLASLLQAYAGQRERYTAWLVRPMSDREGERLAGTLALDIADLEELHNEVARTAAIPSSTGRSN